MRRNSVRLALAAVLLSSFVAINAASTTVYKTKTGHKYHSKGCSYLKKSSISISLDDAKKEGLTPCSKCNPPK